MRVAESRTNLAGILSAPQLLLGFSEEILLNTSIGSVGYKKIELGVGVVKNSL